MQLLQYRSVAFVTYVHECHAQFAKESMACQSMDNDEIMNVRWATEDPNPETKVSEKRRLEEIGAEAVRARMDPRIVDAVRSVRALEEGDAVDDAGNLIEAAPEDEGDERGAKRQRMDDGPSEEEQERLMEESLMELEQTQPTGLLSADTLQGLKYFAQIRQQHAPSTAVQQKVAAARAPPPAAGLGLMDYGSDEDE